MTTFLLKHAFTLLAVCITIATTTSCIDEEADNASDNIAVAFQCRWPDGIDPTAVTNATITLRELNTGQTFKLDALASTLSTLPLGVYDYEGSATYITQTPEHAHATKKTLRAVGSSIEIATPLQIPVEWFFSSPGGTWVFSEIYATGSPNATVTGGLRDTYIKITNNSDETLYADGLGIAESSFVNARTNTFEILTPANNRNLNFTAGTIWVIPGKGTDHPVAPGKSIKIVDQAIDWSTQVNGAINHTDADYEWHDDNAQDTDNPEVPDLDKWYCYSNTIWVISNQCNRSYAIVSFPKGMTAAEYLSDYHGGYDYIHTIGTHMHNDKAYLIPNEWIADGVNLGNSATYVYGALGDGIDISFAPISGIDKDPNRFGKAFRRKTAIIHSNGRQELQDTNDSRIDFDLVKL